MAPDSCPLPEDPALRELALSIEAHAISAELYDERWRVVFTATETMGILSLDPAKDLGYLGMSAIKRNRLFADQWATDRESGRLWWEKVGPSMRHDVRPEDPDFEELFDHMADLARDMVPVDPPPLVINIDQGFSGLEGMRQAWTGKVRFQFTRLHDASGKFIGTIVQARAAIPEALITRLARGSTEMFQQMDGMREPVRRPAAILFADLESSGTLSRTLSSRAYFELIRSLTDLIDTSVTDQDGIIGKHAGDGASALFVVAPGGSESATARSAIEAARAIRAGAPELNTDGAEIKVNIGIHWGSTLTVGQVSTLGRLEVTALGDEMNEAARIEHVATDGAALASKALIERLNPADAAALELDPDGLTYRPVAELNPSEKAMRDAGGIAVVEI